MPIVAGLLIAAAIAIAAQVGIATLTWLSVRREARLGDILEA